MSEVKAELVLAGVDDGYASTKVYLGRGRQFKIMSNVRAGHNGMNSIGGIHTKNDSVGGYETEGQKYTVGDGIDGEGTRFDGYAGSPLNRVVVHHALRVSGLSGKAVKIATGLPVEDFYTDDGVNQTNIDKKRNSFKVPVNSTEKIDTAQITSSKVCAEAVSAYLDHILTDEGKLKPNVNLDNPVGVVDIGGRTTDCVWVCPPNRIDTKHSGTANLGVLDLLDTLERLLRRKFGVGAITRKNLELAATTKKFKVFGEEHDVSAEFKIAADEVSEKIYREIQRRLGSGAELDAIIFVGGGAALMPDIAKKFKNAVIPEHPEYANARGMYKFLKHDEKQ